MNLENTTECICDQLRRAEQARVDKVKVDAVIALALLGLVILTALGAFLWDVWLCWRSRRSGPVSRIPKTPISKENLWEYRRNEISMANVYYNFYSYGSNDCTGKLKEIMRVVFNLKKDSTVYLSDATRVISIRMDGFINGEEFHDFEPADGVIPGSHFTYQMFGKNTIQVTRYAVGSKSYVAGFCIYIKDEQVGDVNINLNVIKKLFKEEKYPGKGAVEMEMKEELENKKANVPSKFAFWRRSGPKTEQNDVPPSYSSLSIV
ncbi:unnamed protein product [Caenorhabditis brenneri]